MPFVRLSINSWRILFLSSAAAYSESSILSDKFKWCRINLVNLQLGSYTGKLRSFSFIFSNNEVLPYMIPPQNMTLVSIWNHSNYFHHYSPILSSFPSSMDPFFDVLGLSNSPGTLKGFLDLNILAKMHLLMVAISHNHLDFVPVLADICHYWTLKFFWQEQLNIHTLLE